MAIMKYNLFYFVATDSETNQTNLMTTLHELTHGLGFDKTIFKSFIDENGNLRKDTIIPFTAANGQQSQGLATPNVLAYARKFYGCDSWYVIPLEIKDDGLSSHFERTLFFNENMTASSIKDAVFSGFTWSVLADSGWYGVDLKNADVFSAG